MTGFVLIAALLLSLLAGCMFGYATRSARPWPYALMVMALAGGVGMGANGLLSTCALVALGCIGMIVGSFAEPKVGS
jgi:hypothetical protein